jgi:hypothetical protein
MFWVLNRWVASPPWLAKSTVSTTQPVCSHYFALRYEYTFSEVMSGKVHSCGVMVCADTFFAMWRSWLAETQSKYHSAVPYITCHLVWIFTVINTRNGKLEVPVYFLKAKQGYITRKNVTEIMDIIYKFLYGTPAYTGSCLALTLLTDSSNKGSSFLTTFRSSRSVPKLYKQFKPPDSWYSWIPISSGPYPVQDRSGINIKFISSFAKESYGWEIKTAILHDHLI